MIKTEPSTPAGTRGKRIKSLRKQPIKHRQAPTEAAGTIGPPRSACALVSEADDCWPRIFHDVCNVAQRQSTPTRAVSEVRISNSRRPPAFGPVISLGSIGRLILESFGLCSAGLFPATHDRRGDQAGEAADYGCQRNGNNKGDMAHDRMIRIAKVMRKMRLVHSQQRYIERSGADAE